MPVNSFNFWLIFPLIFLAYWLIPVRYQKVKKICLLIVSWLLYVAWKPAFALVLLYVVLATYFGALFLSHSEDKCGVGWRGHRWMISVVFTILALLPLLVFKYYNFINESVAAGLSFFGISFKLAGLNWAVPIGLSFYTFQAVGYLFDVYRRQVVAEKNILDYMLFVSFFPQIAAGPISRANELLPQLKTLKPFEYKQGTQGLKALLWGMFLKVVIADRVGMYVDSVYGNYMGFSGGSCALAAIFYSIQIYCDFAGYSLMAIGIAETLGINLVTNFSRPYLAVSVTDFWKRWHISLTRWLTYNIYIPLGGSRCSRGRCYFNILITFIVSGIWHGAAWTFIIWGIMHGIIQILEKWIGLQKYVGKSIMVKTFRIVITFCIVTTAWIFFRAPDIHTAFAFIAHLFSGGIPSVSMLGGGVVCIIALSIAILLFKEVREEFIPSRFRFLNKRGVKWAVCAIVFCMILIFGVLDGGQFIYASF